MSEVNDAIVQAGQDTPVVVNEAQTPEVTQDNVTPAPEGTETPESEVKAQAEKTLTQSEVNEIIQREKAKAEAKAERRANKAYRETLERLMQQKQETPPQASDGRPERARFQSDEEWVEAVADWKIGLRDRQVSQYRAQEQQRSLIEKAERIYAEAEKIKGFDRQAFDEIPLTPVISAAIMESDVSAKLMSYIVDNPDEMSRIVRLTPARQAAEVGRLEAKVMAVKTPEVSKAPAPISPVGGNKGGSKDPTEMTDAEFAKWRREQIKQRGS